MRELGIAPSEAWKMDLSEYDALLDTGGTKGDISLMVNANRKMNGAKGEQWLLNR